MNWRTLFKSRYVASLEAEIVRLRAREEALLDAMLKANHLPGIVKQEPVELPHLKRRMLPSQWRSGIEGRHIKAVTEKQ